MYIVQTVQFSRISNECINNDNTEKRQKMYTNNTTISNKITNIYNNQYRLPVPDIDEYSKECLP